MAVDVQWLFDELLPAQCERYPALVRGLDATFQVHITGRDGGDWFLDLRADPPAVRPGVEEAECTITMSGADFQRLHANPLMHATTLYVAGKVKAFGDPSLFGRFVRVFTLPRP